MSSTALKNDYAAPETFFSAPLAGMDPDIARAIMGENKPASKHRLS